MKLTQDLYAVFYDMQTIKKELEQLNDGELMNACLMDIEMFQRHDLDALYDKLAIGKKLTGEERTSLESFYILANIDFTVNE